MKQERSVIIDSGEILWTRSAEGNSRGREVEGVEAAVQETLDWLEKQLADQSFIAEELKGDVHQVLASAPW